MVCNEFNFSEQVCPFACLFMCYVAKFFFFCNKHVDLSKETDESLNSSVTLRCLMIGVNDWQRLLCDKKKREKFQRKNAVNKLLLYGPLILIKMLIRTDVYSISD